MLTLQFVSPAGYILSGGLYDADDAAEVRLYEDDFLIATAERQSSDHHGASEYDRWTFGSADGRWSYADGTFRSWQDLMYETGYDVELAESDSGASEEPEDSEYAASRF